MDNDPRSPMCEVFPVAGGTFRGLQVDRFAIVGDSRRAGTRVLVRSVLCVGMSGHGAAAHGV